MSSEVYRVGNGGQSLGRSWGRTTRKQDAHVRRRWPPLPIYRDVKAEEGRSLSGESPNAPPRLLVNRSTAARMMGVSVHMINVWVREGVLEPVCVTDHSERRYRCVIWRSSRTGARAMSRSSGRDTDRDYSYASSQTSAVKPANALSKACKCLCKRLWCGSSSTSLGDRPGPHLIPAFSSVRRVRRTERGRSWRATPLCSSEFSDGPRLSVPSTRREKHRVACHKNAP